MGRNRERHDAAGAQDAAGLAESRNVVVEMLDDLTEDHCVEARVRKRQRGHIGSDDGSANALLENVAGRRGDVRAHDVEAPLLELRGERSLSRPGVQDLAPRLRGQEEPEEEPLAQLVPRPDEVGRRSPLVGH
jgi:hypothetical protein